MIHFLVQQLSSAGGSLGQMKGGYCKFGAVKPASMAMASTSLPIEVTALLVGATAMGDSRKGGGGENRCQENAGEFHNALHVLRETAKPC